MELPVWLHPTATGLSLAAAAVASGAPLFSDGLRALRLRSLMPRLREVALARTALGMAHARGTVVLESPLFSPLSRVPCAGFRLEVRGVGTPLMRAIEVFRPFRICSGGVSARVSGGRIRWLLSETATRDVTHDHPLTQNLASLLLRVPEAQWLRRSRMTLRITERALLEGTECHLVGELRAGGEIAEDQTLGMAATGTHDVFETVAPWSSTRWAPRTYAGAPACDLEVEAGEPLGYLLVSDRPPEPRHFGVPAVRVLGMALGPLLSLAGLVYLALAADRLRTVPWR